MALICLIVVSARASANESVKVQLRWTHQFQFAGYYMAKEKGFYQKAGLDVELIAGGPHALRPIEDLLSDKVDYAVTGSGVVIDRMEGKPVVALAAIMQTSPIVWITLKSSDIRGPMDMADRKLLIMPPPESAELLTMLAREGIRREQLNIVPTSYRIEDLIDGEADAYDGYISNEPYLLTQRGVEYNIINPRDYGVNFYSDVLITTERLARKDPAQVRSFRDATLRGWGYALNHMEETVKLIHRRYAPGKSLDHLRYEARTIRELVLPDLVELGHMNPGRWQYIADSYRDLEMTQADANLDGFLFRAEQGKVSYKLAMIVAATSLLLLTIMAMVIFKFRSLSTRLALANVELEELARTDQLTRLKNRHGFVEMVPVVLNQSRRHGASSTFVMFDIDYFKSVNDRYGHLAGDAALLAFAKILSANRREHDVVARLGGEEFGLLLTGAGEDAAVEVTRGILNEIRALKIVAPDAKGSFSITASAGIAEASGELEAFWGAADKALYRAKEGGRDSYSIAPGDTVHEPPVETNAS
ncbi:Response regulator [Marinobacter nitratireducens]|uniref:Thiamine pyrimidine synthase n=1 Tax=Marinobacter nitratireducens TaxID=1137280 RepID=A0A072MXA8_9GAMM|nr:GGDEF domain-containing protein [Marinobacter nitratireducens]KEF30044.1 Response regulator [Marinobacter nitratireducens]